MASEDLRLRLLLLRAGYLRSWEDASGGVGRPTCFEDFVVDWGMSRVSGGLDWNNGFSSFSPSRPKTTTSSMAEGGWLEDMSMVLREGMEVRSGPSNSDLKKKLVLLSSGDSSNLSQPFNQSC